MTNTPLTSVRRNAARMQSLLALAVIAASTLTGTHPVALARIVLLGAALVSVPIALVVQRLRDGPSLAAAVGAGTVALLVLARLGDLVRSEREARCAAEEMQLLLADQNGALRELDRLKDDFVVSVSHELRVPLTSIGGYVDLLVEGEGGEVTDVQRQHLGVVSRNTVRLLGLVDDLLFVSGIRAGRLGFRDEAVEISEVVEHAIDALRPAAATKRIELRFENHGPAVVRGESGRLTQVVENLLANAVKFSFDDSAVVVRVSVVDGSAVVEVRDSGIGIPPEEQERLFERFFRSSTAVAQAIPGTGLGLYISRAIAEAHGGTITIASDETVGTCFTFTLPLAASPGLS